MRGVGLWCGVVEGREWIGEVDLEREKERLESHIWDVYGSFRLVCERDCKSCLETFWISNAGRNILSLVSASGYVWCKGRRKLLPRSLTGAKGLWAVLGGQLFGFKVRVGGRTLRELPY